MSNNIVLKRGLDIPLMGKAEPKIGRTIMPDIIAVKATDFRGLIPRLLVREGDKVLAGSPVLADKSCPDILFTSPLSGTVQEIVRGEKRKLLELRIKVDKEQEAVDFGKQELNKLSAEQIKDLLLKSGLWPYIIQRPYGVIADPNTLPKAIFISAFSTAVLAADEQFCFEEDIQKIQVAINVLKKFTNVPIVLSMNSAKSKFNAKLSKIENVEKYYFSGPHPSGNVGVQISHISPIQKSETVWTLNLVSLVAIGRLFSEGKLDLRRKVAICGPRAINPSYVEAYPGLSVKEISEFYDLSQGEIRFISGDVLSGRNIGPEGFLSLQDNQITLLSEGYNRELFGWAKPFRTKKFSFSKSYFSWLLPKKKYSLDTNMNGGHRAFMMSDVYEKVLPMEIFPIFLVKACLSNNIDDMEKYGIYEVLPEDLALCEFVDPSKNNIQEIISRGIDKMIKEMS